MFPRRYNGYWWSIALEGVRGNVTEGGEVEGEAGGW
jgi:hypothetical protein